MKIIVVHDKRGSIKSVAVPSPEFSGQLTLKPPRGQSVSVVEAPDLKDEKDFESVHQIRENFQIKTSGKPTLIKRRRT